MQERHEHPEEVQDEAATLKGMAQDSAKRKQRGTTAEDYQRAEDTLEDLRASNPTVAIGVIAERAAKERAEALIGPEALEHLQAVRQAAQQAMRERMSKIRPGLRANHQASRADFVVAVTSETERIAREIVTLLETKPSNAALFGDQDAYREQYWQGLRDLLIHDERRELLG